MEARAPRVAPIDEAPESIHLVNPGLRLYAILISVLVEWVASPMTSSRLTPFSLDPSPSSAPTMLRRWITRRSAIAPHVLDEGSVALDAAIGKLTFLRSLALGRLPRESGTGIFVTPWGGIDANAFILFLAAKRILPEHVLFVSWHFAHVPHVAVDERVNLTQLGEGIFLATVLYGFNDDPDIPRSLHGIDVFEADAATTHYYVASDRVAPEHIRGMSTWRRWLFAMMSKICVPAADCFSLPADRTTEIRGANA
jgi:K+ transporter